MELVSLETADEQKKIVELIKQLPNLSRDFMTSGYYDEVERRWKWTANVPPRTFQNVEDPQILIIQSNEPFNLTTLVIERGEEPQFFYICEDVGLEPPARRYEALIQSNLCPSDIGMNSTCRRIPKHGCYCISELYRTVQEAAAYCKNHGMSLVAIETKEESDELSGFIRSNLRGRTEYDELFWTSGKEEPDGPWKWTSTGRELSFTNWDRDWPKDSNKGKTRWIRLSRVKGLWRDTAEEADWIGYFICEA